MVRWLTYLNRYVNQHQVKVLLIKFYSLSSIDPTIVSPIVGLAVARVSGEGERYVNKNMQIWHIQMEEKNNNNAASTSSTTKSFSRSYSDTFPRQKSQQCPPASSSSSALSSPGPSPSTSPQKQQRQQQQHEKKNGPAGLAAFGGPGQPTLAATTRFAFTELIITILRLDFHHAADEHSVTFCNKALDVLLKWGNLPANTQSSLRLNMQDGNPFNEDIGALITSIKSDPVLKELGYIPLLGSFLLGVLVVDGDYDARFRVLIRHIAALLGMNWDLFEEFESTLADRLVDEYKESLSLTESGKEDGDQQENRQIREKKTRMKRYKRYAIIGAATGLGGVIIGVTGGIAAPLIVSSIGALTATTIFAGMTGVAGAALFGSIFGVAGAGLSGYRMQKRVGEVEEFVIERLTEEQSCGLHCVLCVSGWIEERQSFRQHWRHLWMSREQYTLRWESKYLEELGKSIEYFVSFVVSYAIQRSLMETVLASLVTAIAWPLVLLGSSSLIDNPWNICTRRAVEAGEHLAEALLTRAHGRRPITLIGFSLGARVIFHCLLEMSKRRPDSLGIIDDVILLGAPVSASNSQWRQICSVVAGRVINGYCKTDWLLRFLYRTMSAQFIIAGTGPVENREERKIVNFNVSHIVKGHMDYAKKLTKVLEAVGVRVTPLSRESKSNLQKLAEQEEQESSASRGGPTKSGKPDGIQQLYLDEPSTVVERLHQLNASSKDGGDIDVAEEAAAQSFDDDAEEVGEEEEGEEEDGEDQVDDIRQIGLIFRQRRRQQQKQQRKHTTKPAATQLLDPLGAAHKSKSLESLATSVAETYHSAETSFHLDQNQK